MSLSKRAFDWTYWTVFALIIAIICVMIVLTPRPKPSTITLGDGRVCTVYPNSRYPIQCEEDFRP